MIIVQNELKTFEFDLYLLSDFISWLMSSVPDNVLQNYIDQIFAKYDRDNSGTLDAN